MCDVTIIAIAIITTAIPPCINAFLSCLPKNIIAGVNSNDTTASVAPNANISNNLENFILSVNANI